jgi:hypothetical protein
MMERIETDTRPLLLAMGLGGVIALALALLPAPQFLLGFVAGGVALLTVFNRRAALYLILPAIALTPEIRIAVIPIRIEDLLMVPLAAGWLAHLCIFKDRQQTPLDRLLLAYVAVGLLATLWGGYLGTAHFTALTKDYSAPFHLLKRVEFALLIFIVADTLNSAREAQRLTYMLMASMLGLSAYGLMTFLSSHFIATAPVDPGHEPGIASMINVALALSLFTAAKPSAKLLLAAVLVFSLAVLPLTLGRNYIATTGIILLYVGLLQQRWVLATLPILLLIGLIFYPPHVIHQVETLQNALTPDVSGVPGEGASLLFRTLASGHFGLIALGNSPLLGFGLAALPLGHFDSEYGNQFFYTGLVGLAVFLMLGARLFRLTNETLRTAGNPLNAGLARGFNLVWIAYAAHSIFSPSISTNRGGAVFFVMAGLLVVLHRSVTGSNTEQTSPRASQLSH